MNHELFCKRIEYTDVAFYPVSIPGCHLYFRREGGGVKIYFKLGKIIIDLKAKPDQG